MKIYYFCKFQKKFIFKNREFFWKKVFLWLNRPVVIWKSRKFFFSKNFIFYFCEKNWKKSHFSKNTIFGDFCDFSSGPRQRPIINRRWSERSEEAQNTNFGSKMVFLHIFAWHFQPKWAKLSQSGLTWPLTSGYVRFFWFWSDFGLSGNFLSNVRK